MIRYDSSFPKKVTKTQHIYKHWIKTGIKISCKRKRELLLLCRHSNDPNLKTYYKRYCNLLSNVIISEKEHYYRIILKSKNKIITTWKIINHENRKPNHCKNTISLRSDNKEITNDNTVASIFNSYFLSIAESLNLGYNKHTNIKEPNPISYLINSFHQPFPKMSQHYASTYEIEKIIKSLKSKNTGGYDEISTRILKLSVPYIISALTYICNAILNMGVFPDWVKHAIIKPIFKKGDDQDITNYKPISLLTSFSKVIEKLIYARILDCITTNSILVNEKYGFRT